MIHHEYGILHVPSLDHAPSTKCLEHDSSWPMVIPSVSSFCSVIIVISHNTNPTPSRRQNRPNKRLQPLLKHLIRNPDTARMLDGRQRILHHILDIQIRPNLMQIRPQIILLGICEHHKFHPRRGLVIVKFVFAGSIGQESIVFAAEFLYHVAEGEDEAEDEFLVVGVGHGFAGGRGGGDGVRGHAGVGLGACGGFGGGAGYRADWPALAVDAFGMAVEDVEGI